MPKNSSWGIEVGSDAIKAIRLVQHGGEVTVDAYEIVPFRKILTTPGLDVDQTIQDGLRALLAKQPVRQGQVVVSVPGRAAFAKFAKLPPVDPKKIPDIVKFEAVQQIPFPIEEVEWDYQVFTHQDSPDVEVGIFAITKERLHKILDNFTAVGLSVDGVTLSALAVYNALTYDLEHGPDSPGTILMDIGTTSTDVIIIEGDNLWLRTLPIGGNSFSEALVRAFKLSFTKAEKLKREAATSKYARQIFQAMRPVFGDLIQEVQKTLGFYHQSQGADREVRVTTLIGVGSSFRLAGMQKFLRQQLQMEVRRLDHFKRIGVEGKKAADFAEHSLNLVTAFGLALQGLNLGQVNANLLPVGMTKQRVWQSKQPWFAAAAALMVVASVAAWVRLKVDTSLFDNAMSVSQPRVDQTLHTADEFVQMWRQIEGSSDPRRRIENLRRILDYRRVWPKVIYDLMLAAGTLDSQPELLTSDYDQIGRIDRSERRRVYIDSISARYQLGSDDTASGSGGAQAAPGLTIEDIWGRRSDRQVGDGSAQTPRPPSFVITVKGTTPHKNGPKLISQHMIRWIKENSERHDRPYRIMVNSTSLESIERISDDRPAADTAGRVSLRGGRSGLRNGQPRTVRASDARRSAASIGRADGEIAPARLFPRRPLSDEPRVGDWVFVLRWTIQLLRPEDTRRAEDSV